MIITVHRYLHYQWRLHQRSEPVAQSLIPTSSTPTARFERQQAEEFARRSNSEQTRRAYQRVVREFFAAMGNLHPTVIAPTHICRWRDTLLRRKQKAATVPFKLSMVRAFFGYLKDLGLHERNPADIEFVPPPALPETQAGQVQMMSGHKDPKTVMRYDTQREDVDRNAVSISITKDREAGAATTRIVIYLSSNLIETTKAT